VAVAPFVGLCYSSPGTLNRPLWIAFLLTGLPAALGAAPATPPPIVPLPQDVYLWQRAWTGPVRDAIAHHAAAFSNVVVLAAEVSWKQRQPQVVRVPVDYDALRAAKCPVGLALRLGPFSGPFAEDDKTARFLASLTAALLAEARAKGLAPSELQLDFDCAESKLEGYRVWVTALRRRVAPTPLVLTALPSWLRQPAFKPLVAAADGYVLQVHSLEPPKDFTAPFTLCDPVAAQRAVERAGAFGVPFRVALPTYGYLVAFAPEGRFVGLSAEGPARSWPVNARLREVRADPLALARLVQMWTTNRPPAMRGVIWYRLPVADDTLNWRWPTLGAIVAARSPHESVRAEPRRVEAGLIEVSLVNEGELDISSRLAVEVRWLDARLVAGDGLRDFELVEAGASTARFQTKSLPRRLAAAERRVIGWLRLNQDREVQVEIKKF